MCTLLFAHAADPLYPLVVAANRDERYDRATRALAPWPERPSLIAGRDLESGGTWMALGRDGRWAALTNVREPQPGPTGARTRGELVTGFFDHPGSAMSYLEMIRRRDDLYNGFNLVVGDPSGVYYCSNRGPPPSPVAPGIHGLSNAGLDTPWPKVKRGKAALRRAIEGGSLSIDPLLDLLADRRSYADHLLPDTGIGIATERLLAPLFISTPHYGTRSSTVLLIDRHHQAQITELSVDAKCNANRVDLEIKLANTPCRP